MLRRLESVTSAVGHSVSPAAAGRRDGAPMHRTAEVPMPSVPSDHDRADAAIRVASAVVARWLRTRLRLREPIDARSALVILGTRITPSRWRRPARIWAIPLITLAVGPMGIPETLHAIARAVLDALPLPVTLACLIVAGRALDIALRRLGGGRPAAPMPVEGPPPPPVGWPGLSGGPGSPVAAARRPARTRTPGPGTTARRRTSRDGSRPAGTRGPRPRTA